MAEPEMRPAEMCNEFTSQGSIGRPTCLGSVQAGHWTGGPALLPTEARQSLAAEAQRLQHLAQQRLGASAVVPSFEAFLASRHPTVAPNALILDSAAPPVPSAVAHASAPQPSSPEQAGSGESSSPVTPSTPLRSAPSSAPSSAWAFGSSGSAAAASSTGRCASSRSRRRRPSTTSRSCCRRRCACRACAASRRARPQWLPLLLVACPAER